MTEDSKTQVISGIPPYRSSPYSIIPIPLFTAEAPGQGRFTYLVDIEATFKAGVYVWYIKGPDLNILVDAGINLGGIQARGLEVGSALTGDKTNDDPVTPGLSKIGLTPEDIDIVILTHLHHDHCGMAHLYKNAKFIVQRKELQSALYEPPVTQRPMYNKKLFENLDFLVVEGDVKIIDGVWVILTPGHTHGGQSVVVDTTKGRAVISGLCSIQMNFEPPKPYSTIWPVIAPGIHTDVEQSYQNILRIKTLADIPVALHDSKWSEVASIPE